MPVSNTQRLPLALSLMLAVFLVAAGRSPAVAQNVPSVLPSVRLPLPPLPSSNSFFSFREVAIDGDTAVVASALPNLSGGSAWVFRRTRQGWRQEARLAPAAGEVKPTLGFGASVAISGGTIVVGGPSDGVFVFVRDAGGWREQALLPTRRPNNDFGREVAISGDRILVAASAAASQVIGGAAFAFVRASDSWQLDGSFVDETSNAYGGTVAVSGNLAAVGRFGMIDLFIHGRGAWNPRARIEDPMNVGTVLAFSGTTLAAGSLADFSVKIFVWRAGSWEREAELPVERDTRVALDRDTLVLGTRSGPVVVYRRSAGAWSLTAKLTLPPGAPSSGFGRSVAVSGRTAVVAADRAAWVFELPDGP
jgi:hypothetical protein